jgi:DNA-binding MarR family transcriptional regulator
MNDKREAMVNVMHSADLSPGARLLWWELNQWIGHGIDACFPPQPKLAEVLGVSRSSIIRWAQELSNKGLLRVERQQRGNKYVLNSAAPLS